MIILVDQDGVLADYEQGMLNRFRELYPDEPFVPLEQRTTFYVEGDYPEKLKPGIRTITKEKGFYRNLPPMAGALEALAGLQEQHEVFICTSPLSAYQNCVLEKFEWVDEYLGPEWIRRLRIEKDKTLTMGDILIDDRPEVTGLRTPVWQHILFDQPYNRHIKRPRLNWRDYQEVLESLSPINTHQFRMV